MVLGPGSQEGAYIMDEADLDEPLWFTGHGLIIDLLLKRDSHVIIPSGLGQPLESQEMQH